MKEKAPREAMAEAMQDSETVSMGEETNGRERERLRERGEERETASVGKSMKWGRKMRSS